MTLLGRVGTQSLAVPHELSIESARKEYPMRIRLFPTVVKHRLPVVFLVGAMLIIMGWFVFAFFGALETLNAEWRFLGP
jgi:hypothetical protein